MCVWTADQVETVIVDIFTQSLLPLSLCSLKKKLFIFYQKLLIGNVQFFVQFSFVWFSNWQKRHLVFIIKWLWAIYFIDIFYFSIIFQNTFNHMLSLSNAVLCRQSFCLNVHNSSAETHSYFYFHII